MELPPLRPARGGHADIHGLLLLPAKAHLNFSFLYGIALDDPDGLLIGPGKTARGLRLKPGDIIPEDQIVTWLNQAVRIARGDE